MNARIAFRFVAAALSLASMRVVPADATSPLMPPPHLDIQYQRAFLRNAPIHLQAQIIALGVSYPARCSLEVEAGAVKVFKGAAQIPEGRHFLLILPSCETPPGTAAGRPGHPWPQPGMFFEAFLRHFGPPIGYHLAGFDTADAPEERFRVIDHATDLPQINLPPMPPGSKMTAASYVEDPDPGLQSPPRFTQRDATVVFTQPERPGETFRAYYEARSWRTRVETVAPEGETRYRLSDGFGQWSVVVSPRRQEYQPDSKGGWTGFVGIYDSDQLLPGGADQIAGLTCQKYTISFRNYPPSEALARFCTTDFGLPLRMESHFLGYENVDVKQVTLGAVPDSLFQLPSHYRMKAAEK